MAVLDSDMNRMQQDAIRRMREMQTRAIPQKPNNQQDTRSRGDRTQQRQSSPAAHPTTAPHSAARNEPRTPNRQPEPTPRQTAPHPPQGTVHSSRSAPVHAEPHHAQREPEPHRQPEPIRQEPPPPQAVPEKPASPLTGFFEMLFKDSDRTLILALLLVLYEEKADPSLLFALMYIAL